MVLGQGWQAMFEMPQIAIVMGTLIPIAGIIAFAWHRTQLVRSQNELKQSMIARGMSADEIERVLGARAAEPRDL